MIMNHSQMQEELKLLTKLYQEYSFFNTENNKNPSNIIQAHNIKELEQLIKLSFISETFYLQNKIKDAIYFLKKIMSLQENIRTDYNDYDMLYYLFLKEYKKIKNELHILDEETKEHIVYSLNMVFKDYINSYSSKELELFSEIIAEYREYAKNIKIAESIKILSPNDKNFNSLKRSMLTVSDYFARIDNPHIEQRIKSEINEISSMKISKANRRIKEDFDKELIFILLRYFSDGTVEVIETNDTNNVKNTSFTFRYKNPRIRFYKEKPQSKKLSNKIKDELIKYLCK